MWAVLALWLVFALTGFRLPWTPLGASGEATGSRLRPLVFAGGACWGLLVLSRGGWRWATQERALSLTLVGALFLTVLWSPQPGASAKRVILVACGFCVFLAAAHSAERPREAWSRFLAWSLGLAGWTSLAARVALPEGCSVLAERPGLAGITPHPNTLGPAMAIGVLCALCLTPRSRWERCAQPLLVLGCALALLLTESMTSLTFGMLGVGLTVLGSTPRGSYARGVWQLCALCVGALGLCALAGVGVGGLLESVGRDASLTGRDVLWAALWDTAWERPVFGHGFGGFWTPNRGLTLVGTWNPRQAHNTYLDVFVELGILGALGWAIWLGGGLARLWRQASPGAEAALRGACVGLLIYGGGESYWLRFDKIPFLCLAGAVLLPAHRPRGG